MAYARRSVLTSILVLIALTTAPLLGRSFHPVTESRGLVTSSKSVQPLAAGIFFSGNFSWSVGGGQAILKADTVTNPNGTASGPLRFSLWFTPTPYPSSGFSTASYDITPSLAAGASIAPVNGGSTGVPFTDPPAGCYNVALVLEENVSGTWTMRDYGNFSLKMDIGGGCITSFTASPSTISSGGSSTLSWTTGGGSVTSVTIDNGVGSKPANGSAVVNPTATTTYTLSAFSTANSTPPSKQVTVSISQPPPTATFSASPTSINSGQNSTLSWSTTNATSVSIDHGVGSEPLNGSVSVSPTATTTYTLTVTGPGGTITRTATINVAAANAPVINFTANPTFIGAGSTSTLTWSTSNTTSVTIDNGLGSRPLSGSVIVTPAATTVYTLTATGPGGTATSQATVAIIPAPTVTFFADKTTIASGSPATLTWITTGADTVTIDQGIGLTTGNGSLKVTPHQTTTYHLIATNGAGSTPASVTITVTDSAPSRHRAVKH